MRLVRIYALILVISMFGSTAWGQVATGAQPFVSFTGGPFDTVNNGNLNVHFGIPVLYKAGRGLPFYYFLAYDNSVWSPASTGGSTVWTPTANWGWSTLSDGATGYVTYHSTALSCQYLLAGRLHTYYYTTYWGFDYVDSVGSPRPFPGLISSSSPPCAPGLTSSMTSTASDGSGYELSVSAGPSGTVYSSTGTVINAPFFASSPTNVTASMVDPNGNQISESVSGSVTFTDTLNTTALSVSGTGTPSSPISLSYIAAGGSGQVVIKYAAKTVQTNFGCSNIVDFGPTSENLVTEIDMPDISTNPSDKYTFTYETTPGHSGNVTGRLASVTLPTGGTISYAYEDSGDTIPNDGINCSDGSTTYLARTTPDNPSQPWVYTHSENNTAWTTVLTDPNSNATTFKFQSATPQHSTVPIPFETERDLPGGAGTVYSCYNGATKPCNSTSISFPITRRTLWTTLGSQTSEVDTTYDSAGYGLPTEVDEYDWGPSLSRKTLTSYANSSCGVTNSNIVNRPCSITIKNSAGSTVASSSFNYSGNGNLLSATSDGLTLNFTYNSNGTMATSKDAAGNQTTYSYGGNSCGAFPDTVSFPLSLSTSAIWNCDGAAMTKFTDQNSQPTTFSYDDMNRLTSTSYPDGGLVTTSYTPNTITTTTTIASGVTRPDTTTLDGLGRVSSQTVRGVTTRYTYDVLGRVYTETLGSSGDEDTYQYDALARVTKVTHADSDSVNTSYSSNCATTTDEAGKTNQVCSDALGRATKVIDGIGNETDYTYDALNDLTKVTEGSQARTYSYDSLGRLTSAATPESGTTNYYYTTTGSGLCSGDPSAVCRRIDARSITTTYAYDALNRLTSKSYNDNPQTPAANYIYDQGSVSIGSWSSGTLANPKGRVTEATTTASGSVQTGLVYGYDAMGRLKNFWQCTPYNCGSSSIWNMTYNRDLAGDVKSHTLPTGYTISNSVNSDQEITQITSSRSDSTHPGTLFSMTYNSWGALSTLTNGCVGSGCVQTRETYDYNNRLQPVRIQLGTSSTPSANDCLVYNYYQGHAQPTSCTSTPTQASSGDNGTVAGYLYLDSKNPSFSHSASYSYDGLSRLAQASGAPSGSGTNSYGQTFNYDRYGNMTCVVGSSGYCPQVSYYTSTNHINQIGSTSAGYDLAGNMTSDVSHTFQYDAEGRLAEGTNPTQAFVYNALGQRVVWGDAYFAVDPEGRHVAQWDGWLNAYAVSGVFRFGGQMIGGYYDAYTPANDTWMIHRNVLGSTSMVTDHAGTEISDVTDYPWGDVWIADASKEYHFAGFNYRFSALGIDPAINREYEYGLGRWLSPDPMGGDVTNPQSLNRYAYVLNNPTTLNDPLGLDSGDCEDPAYADGHAECQGPGSVWCSQFPYSPMCSGYPGGGRGTGGVGGGGAPAPPSAPPAGQPPLTGMGNAMFGGLITCTYAQVTIGGIPYPHGPTACILAGLGISSAVAYLLSRPWAFGWTVPLLGEPGVAGVGPSGSFYWNPATHNFCGSVGIGLAGGHSGAIGPVTNAWTLQGVPATPSQVDNIFKGLSWSLGANLPSPGGAVGPGVQVSGNGSGLLVNPNVGVVGVGISATFGLCTE